MNVQLEASIEEFLSVSVVTQLLNQTLERSHSRLLFEGELSEVKRAQSGHVYAAIKDEHSQISIVLWAGTVRTLGFEPEVGMSVRCRGRPTIYAKTGRFQIVVDKMSPAGEGALQKKFLALKEKLGKEGLFSETRKRPLPFLPRAIGIVTSMDGAAIHDMLVRLRERMPQVPLYAIDVRVQGPGAAHDIATGIEYIASTGLVDVIITGRGGGSLEDLWAFNEEQVVRAIFACPIPVISAVGHEVDITLSDLVADVRAPTPTAAAEMVVPRRADLLSQVLLFEQRLNDSDRWFQPKVQALDDCASTLQQNMKTLMQSARLLLDNAGTKLRTIEPREFLETLQARLLLLQRALHRAFPLERLQAQSRSLELAENRLSSAVFQLIRERVSVVKAFSGRLDALSPRKVLERGYSIVEGNAGIIRSASQVRERDNLRISFSEGYAVAQVTKSGLEKGITNGKGKGRIDS